MFSNDISRYLSSDYFTAANALSGKKAKRTIVVYVESYDDVFFWRSILSNFETEQRKFSVTLPTRNDKLERGKKAALLSALRDNVGPDMLACVDADYDYLRQGCTTLSHQLLHNPYVFHTYAYSIENLQCWAPALHNVCVMVTLNDSSDIPNFEAFLSEYSMIIFPLFVWSVLCARDKSYGRFDIADFMLVIKTGSIAKHSITATLQRIQKKVTTHLRRLNSSATVATQQAYHRLIDELQALGITPQDTYLYIQGHQLFNEVVAPLLTYTCNDLIRQRQREIQTQSKHSTQRRNELACYEHSIENVSSMLKKHTLYLRAPLVRRIFHDIQQYLDNDTHND